MDLGLHGKRALITGGSRGIGLAVARALSAEGAALGLVARDAGGLAEAARKFAGQGAYVATAAADVTDTVALTEAVERNSLVLPAHFGPPHVGRVRRDGEAFAFIPG